MHVAIVGSLEIRNADQIKGEGLCLRGVRSFHGRLIARHAIVRQLDLVAVEIIQRGHFHRPAVIHHAEFFEHRRASGGQLQIQRGFVHVRFVRFPMAHQRFEFFKRFRPVAGGRIWNGQGAHA